MQNKNSSIFYKPLIAIGTLSALVCQTAFAEDVYIHQVAGQVKQSATLTIKGKGFGERNRNGAGNTYPYRYEDAESSVIDNAQLMNSWGSLSQDNNRPGSQFNVLHERGVAKTYNPITTRYGDSRTHSVRYSLSVDVKDQSQVHQYFASAWVRLSDNFANISGNNHNSASLISFQPDRSSVTTRVGGGSIGVAAAKNPAEITIGTSSGELTHYHGSIYDKLTPGAWHRVDAWTSVNNQSTGFVDEVKFWVDGELVASRQQAGFGQSQFPQMQGVHFVSYIKNLNGVDLNGAEQSWSLQTDDHYVDFTPARIELGNAPTFSQSTHREIQLPIDWGNNEIELALNKGAFGAEDDLYLYVVNNDGSVNEQGYPLVSDDTGTSEPDLDFSQININFQSANAAIPLDYLADTGEVFAQRQSGYRYGWTSNITASGRDRNAQGAKDQRYDTLLHMLLESKGFDADWEIELPNGHYQVRLVAGDPQYTGDEQAIDAEGIPFVMGKPNRYHSVENTAVIEVLDGRLTLSTNPDANIITNKPMFIEITQVTGEPDQTPPSPSYALDFIEDDGQIFLSWQNPLFDYSGSLVVISTQPIVEAPQSGIDYANASSIGHARVHTAKENVQTIITDLVNDQIYYVKIYSFDANFNYALSEQLIVKPKATTSIEQERARSLLAVESIGKGNEPDVVYNIHNRFAKTFFGAQAESEVYKLFGDTLVINPKSEWHYVSERSATVAWQTNLPAYSHIEYGKDTTYGLTTAQGERQFYTHNHYLKNLDAQTTYHYRLVSKDERGNVIYSPDRELTTKQYAGKVIRIPDDIPGGAPYYLEDNDTTYVLTQDVTAESGAFRIRGENVVFDLGGHTITHATKLHDAYNKSDMNNNGMAIWRLNYPISAGYLTIVNGTIAQGDAANIGGNYGGYNAIITQEHDKLEVAGITFDYHTAQTYAMYMSFSKNYAYSADYNIHHNVFKDRGWHIVNRHGRTGGRSLLFTGEVPKTGNDFKLHNNLVKRTRQNAFMGATSVLDNEIYVDSWSTNSFAIQPYSMPGQDAGTIRNNKIFLTGYHAIGASWAHENLDVSNNFIHMEGVNTGKNRWWESFGDQNSLNGLRITNYGAGGQVRNDLTYSNNTIVGTARHGSIMRGTEFFSDYSIHNTVLENSTIRLIAEDEGTIRVAPVVTHGTSNLGHQPTTYRHSTLSSNLINVSFGDRYGRGYNHLFDHVHFEKLGDEKDYHTFVFDGGFSRDGHIIRDATFTGGAAWDDVHWTRTGNLSAYSVQWTLSVTAPADATVSIVDVNGVEVFNGVSNGVDVITTPLTQATIRPVEWSPEATGGGVRQLDSHQKIWATPHQVTVTDSAGTISQQSVNMTEVKALSF